MCASSPKSFATLARWAGPRGGLCHHRARPACFREAGGGLRNSPEIWKNFNLNYSADPVVCETTRLQLGSTTTQAVAALLFADAVPVSIVPKLLSGL